MRNKTRLQELQGEMRRRYRPQLRKSGRRKRSVEITERELHLQIVRARAKACCELWLRAGLDTVTVACRLRDAFPGLAWINEQKVADWIARGKPL